MAAASPLVAPAICVERKWVAVSQTAKYAPRFVTASMVVPRFGSESPYPGLLYRLAAGASFVFGSVKLRIVLNGLPYFAHTTSVYANAVAKCRRHTTMA